MCNCVRNLEKELNAVALFADNLNKELSIPFMEKINGIATPKQFADRRKDDIMVVVNFCPFCGEQYRFADEEEIKKYRGEK